MKKRKEDKKKDWHKPAFESLKFSQTLGGPKKNHFETVTVGHDLGTIS